MFISYKRPAHTTLENALAINWYYRPLCYFRPAKMTTLNDKCLVKISHEPFELQMTDLPQTPIEDVQLRVQMTTYQHTNNDSIR